MIDYKKLKKHCSVKYSIGKNTLKIGDLSDNQLELAKKILSTKRVLNSEQKEQLRSVNYVINYRSDRAIERLLSDSLQRRINTASKKADMIVKWIETNYK